MANVPTQSLCLGFEGPAASAEFIENGDEKTPQLNMVIYSGGIIKDHWWWDDLLLDLQGVIFSKKKYPILENHDRNLKIAYHKGPFIVDGNIRVDPNKAVFVSTDESLQFQTISSEGFPYQASARVNPKVIERIKRGSFGEANGIKLKGPATIFRKFEIIEGSVCVFGYDSNTNSSAFSQTDLIEIDCETHGDLPHNRFSKQPATMEGERVMDLQTFSKEHPDLLKQIQKDAVAGASQDLNVKFDEKFKEISSTVQALQSTVESQAATIKDLSDKNLELSKDNALRSQSEMATKAGSIWFSKLSQSEIPEHLHVKVREHVKHDSFIDKETGECDWTQFSAAVDTEIGDWETSLGNGASSVNGGGYNSRTVEDDDGLNETELQEENAWVDDMVALVQDDGGDE